MMSGKGKRRLEGWLFALRRYLAFFLLMAFVISCCMLLFLNELSAATGIALTKDKIESAAKLTFVNILFLSLLCTVIDGLRRKWLVERPVRTIVGAAEQIMKGDFSVRIPPLPGIENNSGFDVIADYFNRMAQELSGTETLRTDFIANVSHELKTPLAVIQNYGTMLQHPGLPEEKRMEYAKAITEASRRLADLITNILKLNKLENQQIYSQVETYDLGEQLCECLLSFEEAWEKKELQIETDVQEAVLVDSRWFGTTCSPTRSNSPSRTAKSPSRCGRRGILPSFRCRIPDAASHRRWENTSLKSFTRGTPPTPPRATAWGLRWSSG